MTDLKKIAKSLVVHFAHICAYGVEKVKEVSIDVLTLYVAYLLFKVQVQTVSWVKKTY